MSDELLQDIQRELLQDIQHELENSEWVGDDGTVFGLPHGTIETLERAAARIRELEAQVASHKSLLDECERVIDDLLHYGHPDWPVCQRALVTLSKIRGEKQTAVLDKLSDLEQEIDNAKT